MTSRKLYAIAAIFLAAAATLLAGCGSSHTKISDILDYPNRFADRQVRVIGEVTQVHELPLGITNLAAYRINDGTGQIWVISHAGAPLRGDRVGIKGRVEPMSNLNLPVLGNILGDVIEEQQRINS